MNCRVAGIDLVNEKWRERGWNAEAWQGGPHEELWRSGMGGDGLKRCYCLRSLGGRSEGWKEGGSEGGSEGGGQE